MNHTAVGDKKKRQSSRSSVLSQTTVHSLPGARHPLRHLLLPRPLRPRPMLCRLQILYRMKMGLLLGCVGEKMFSRCLLFHLCLASFHLSLIFEPERRSCNSEEPLKLYLEDAAMEHHRLALQEGVIHIDQWRGHSAGSTNSGESLKLYLDFGEAFSGTSWISFARGCY
ncbi:uncharacterized protein LOC132799214 isoform X4 [Ziziphus jujuba]|uniref:Uncharacterized protein LOC132799214 isoform X4 n=1 Tax=Ziziphus jujuba TaxID=326968 RepID=A0ABM3ZZZ6_ZIZJJ|nr:uncharacterized protein LOC132799214 isoform X4 [Ziziphus jujuba]XP_060670053.1 uncharacterized protein LOC132799214 isoform X4 [Ziziphus jujuba]